MGASPVGSWKSNRRRSKINFVRTLAGFILFNERLFISRNRCGLISAV